MKKKFSTIDLFAGVGGIRIGFEKAGFKTIFSNDFDEKCKATYDLNFADVPLVVEDIRNINGKKLPYFDFLLAGFPCQAFSIAGYRQGFKDKKGRGNLFFEIARILDEKKPLGVFLENVKNLKGHDNGNTFKIIHKTLDDLGYHIKFQVLNSMDYGNLPQNRERIYIVGFRSKRFRNKFEFPDRKKLKTQFTHLLERSPDKKYYYKGKPLFAKLKQYNIGRNSVYQWRRKYIRQNKKGVCPTLTANMGTGGHNVPIIRDFIGVRKLTPLECFRLQGFPNNFRLPKNLPDSAFYKQAGNSVAVPVVERIAKEIMSVLVNKK